MKNYKTIRYEKLEEQYFEYQHKSGLQVFVIPKKGYSKKTAYFITKYGSLDNKFRPYGETAFVKVPDGIAHFLEHKLFEQEHGNVMDRFAALGSSPNAYTSYNKTAYYFSCTDQFTDNLRLLLQYVQTPYLTEENVEKEKGIIEQEIMMYEDHPGYKVYSNMMKGLYHNHPVRDSVAGTVESVNQITKELLMQCYNTFYHPSNMILVVAGDVEQEQVFRIVAEEIQHTESRPKIWRVLPEEPETVAQSDIKESAQIGLPTFEIGLKCKELSGNKEEDMMRVVAGKMVMKELFQSGSEIYEQLFAAGLINDSFDYACAYEQTYANMIIGGESPDPEKAKEQLYAYILEKQKTGIDPAALERNKKSMKGMFFKRLNSVENIASSFVTDYFRGINLFDYFNVYDTIGVDYANEVLRNDVCVDRAVMSVIDKA